MPVHRLLPILVIAPTLCGCGYFGAIDFPGFGRGDKQEQTELPPPPVADSSVEAAALPPLADPPPAAAPAYQPTDSGIDDPLANAEPYPPGAPGSAELAAPATAADAIASVDTSTTTGATLGRSELLGGWTVSSGTETCQLFMTLTSWTGGYRATTLGCKSTELKSISAWNLEGTQIVLAGGTGSPIARLSSTGGNRFDGQTLTEGTPISFYR
jgi:hypothetical protein